ncbi:hypothetical protein GGR52DRAFT_592616 [Hypoxylon sp. FL1284]|nr:hypothetical protein GGR52DRAFT_592616 [Hypoxylon sp. FL1284]
MATSPSDIYKGFWTDMSEDKFLSSFKLTVSSTTATFLIAFFVFYSAFAASRFWGITAYALHFLQQGRVKERCRPVLRQQQVTLRNSRSPSSTAHRLLQIWWVGVLCAIGSVAAGIYSNQIIDISADVKVLVTSPSYGFVDSANTSIPGQLSMNVAQQCLDSLQAARGYSINCYNTSSTQGCGPFTNPRIDWEIQWDAKCPFGDSMCLEPGMSIDTGLINSNQDLGLNAKPEDQVELRKKTTCAPITQDGYTIVVPSNSTTATTIRPLQNDRMVMSAYGPSGRKLGSNFTWGVSEFAASSTSARTMRTEYFYGGSFANLSTFSSIPELRTTAGDTSLTFISSNALLFVEPCDDPVFAAHVAYHDEKDNYTYYLGDHATGVIGCLEQYQWCNPYTQGLANIPFLGSQETANIVANQKVNGQIQFTLPSNQWQVEVQAWHGTVMKLLQEGILRWVIGPSDPALQEHLHPPASPEQAALCHLLRIRPGPDAGIANVSAFGLFFSLVVGIIIILVSLFIDSVATLLGKFSQKVRTKQQAWIEDDALQLQRIAYEAEARVQEEETGRSPGLVWTGRDEDVPGVEGNNALLGPLTGSTGQPEVPQHVVAEGETTTTYMTAKNSGAEKPGSMDSKSVIEPPIATESISREERLELKRRYTQ